MFYSETLLCRRGKLSRVWLASHWEGRLSKTQFLRTDIEGSVDSMIGAASEPMALRLSSQLLLGLVRIYSRKARYLLEDCKDVVLRLRVSAKGNKVELPKNMGMFTDNPDTVTLNAKLNELDSPSSGPEFDFIIHALENNNTKPQYITLPDTNMSIDRRKRMNEDTSLEIDGIIDLNASKPHENDAEWEFNIGIDDGIGWTGNLDTNFANLEVGGARNVEGPLAYIPQIQDAILSSMHRATDISIIDKKARLDNESSEYSLPIEFARHIDTRPEGFNLNFVNDMSLDHMPNYSNAARNMQALLKPKIMHRLSPAKRSSVVIDKDIEFSTQDFEKNRPEPVVNPLIPSSKRELTLLEIEKLGTEYYTSSNYLPFPKELKATLNTGTSVVPVKLEEIYKDTYMSPERSPPPIRHQDIILDDAEMPFTTINDYLPQQVILSPQSPPNSDINVDLNFSTPLWDSPRTRLEKNSSILSNAIKDFKEPIKLFSLLKNRSRSIAADVFFEVLSLKSKDIINVHQNRPYGDIYITKCIKS